jgi:hypothetical protein
VLNVLGLGLYKVPGLGLGLQYFPLHRGEGNMPGLPQDVCRTQFNGNFCDCNFAEQDLSYSSPLGEKWRQCETLCHQTVELNPRRLT